MGECAQRRTFLREVALTKAKLISVGFLGRSFDSGDSLGNCVET